MLYTEILAVGDVEAPIRCYTHGGDVIDLFTNLDDAFEQAMCA